MTISLDQIKALRDRTCVSITACKKALEYNKSYKKFCRH